MLCIGINVHVSVSAFWAARQLCLVGPNGKSGSAGMYFPLESIDTLGHHSLAMHMYHQCALELACALHWHGI